jgi:protein ImuA
VLNKAYNDNQKVAQSTHAKKPENAGGLRGNSKVAALRKVIDTLERQGTPVVLPAVDEDSHQICDSAVSWVDAFPKGNIHEVWAEKPDDQFAATAFTLSILKETKKPFLWVTSQALLREHGMPYGPGLQAAGIDPAMLLLVQCRTQQDVLWVLEEALKSKALAAVIGEVGAVDLTASRRLVLAAREYNTQGLLLVRTASMPSSAAYSRWKVEPAVSNGAPFDVRAPGIAGGIATRVKHRGGKRPVTHKMEWDYATDHIPVAASMADQLPAATVGRRAAR